MKSFFFASLSILFASPLLEARDLPLAQPELVFEEKNGLVVVEAEHFYQQEKDGVRAWHLTTKDRTPNLKPDADPNHTAGASGGAYLEILPDTRKNHDEKLIQGENFINQPGKMAVTSYQVHFNTPGKYYVWARVHSTGTEDNGMHVGIDGTWPASGQRMQWTGKRQWIWNSKQRTEKQHGGVRGLLFLKVEKPGEHTIHFSMREDGFEFDQWLMTTDPDFAAPKGPVNISDAKAGKTPEPFPLVVAPKTPPTAPAAGAKKPAAKAKAKAGSKTALMGPNDFAKRERLYADGKWLAVNPKQHKDGRATGAWPFNEGTFDLTLHAVGENDGESTYQILLEGESVGTFTTPLSGQTTEEGMQFSKTFKNVLIRSEAMIEVVAKVGTQDNENHSRARWSGIEVKASDGKNVVRKRGEAAAAHAAAPAKAASAPKPSFTGELFGQRGTDGSGEVAVSGELKKWHKVSLTLNGPWAHEKDNAPNPFTDYYFGAAFTHPSGAAYTIPGYFAADGNAGETSAESGNQWRVHFAPDLAGKWDYEISFSRGKLAGLDIDAEQAPFAPFDSITGSFTIAESDKTGRDFRAEGRLNYVGKHHLEFAETGRPFIKAGADAPETFLGYADFDGTVANNPKKVPLKTWEPHIRDWQPGDPTWQDGKGKGVIGAINYLSGKGANVFSFLPYNAGGDGDNVWPFIERNDPLNYDCSKLDQWEIVFDHAKRKGMFLHFKLQETENDDQTRGGHGGSSKGNVPTALDGGDLGPERKLYCRELVARFGHHLALNWNLGEENTQTTQQQKDMARYLADADAYDHLIVVHTFPNQQDKVYRPLLGENSVLRGASLQNSNVKDCHQQIVKWTRASAEAGVPWVVSFDEPGTASEGMPADPGYPGMPDNFDNPSIHTTRKQVLWGTLLGGGGGVEYYFGYKLPQNDLVCEDWRSRDQSWDYCNIALSFFRDHEIPLNEMSCHDELIGNPEHDNSAYCFAKPGELYLVYLPEGGSRDLDLGDAKGDFSVLWFNPREGGKLKGGESVKASGKVSLTAPDAKDDWLAVVTAK